MNVASFGMCILGIVENVARSLGVSTPRGQYCFGTIDLRRFSPEIVILYGVISGFA